MTEEEFKKIPENELWQKSVSVHKHLQLHQMTADGKVLEGQESRYEDANGNPSGSENFDEVTARMVIYTFKNGVINSDGDTPAIEYPGHWEYWKDGLIEKIVSDYGRHVEHWENGVPVSFEDKE